MIHELSFCTANVKTVKLCLSKILCLKKSLLDLTGQPRCGLQFLSTHSVFRKYVRRWLQIASKPLNAILTKHVFWVNKCVQKIILKKFENQPLFWTKTTPKSQLLIFYKTNSKNFLSMCVKNRPWGTSTIGIQPIPQKCDLYLLLKII